MPAIEVIRAPDIRVTRGEVSLTERTIEDKNGRVTGRTRGDVINNWLRRYWKRREIDDLQFKAGVRFEEFAEQMQIGIPSNLFMGGANSGGALDLGLVFRGQKAYAARREWAGAVQAMGLTIAPAVVWVVVVGRPASEWAKAERMMPREGITTLKLGLSSLVTYWGLTASGTRA